MHITSTRTAAAAAEAAAAAAASQPTWLQVAPVDERALQEKITPAISSMHITSTCTAKHTAFKLCGVCHLRWQMAYV
jgi:hypothetical protein